MQLFKHMEVILMLAFGIVCATVALQPAATGRSGSDRPDAMTFTITRIDAPATMPFVHVIGRRLTPAEKQAGAATAG